MLPAVHNVQRRIAKNAFTRIRNYYAHNISNLPQARGPTEVYHLLPDAWKY